MNKKIWLTLGLVGAACQANANDSNILKDGSTDERFYIAPYGSFVHGGNRNSDDGWGGGLGIGKIINKNFNVELKGFYQRLTDFNHAGQGNWNMLGGTLETQYFFYRDTLSPYALIGAGGMSNNVPGKSAASFIAETGLGLNYEVNEHLSLNSDVRYRYNHDFNGNLRPGVSDFHDLIVNVGFILPIGERDKPFKPMKFSTAPAPQASCKNKDTDRDGVNDCDDRCPGTLKDSQIDRFGCPIRVELKGVQFKHDSAELTDAAKIILDKVAESLMSYQQKKDIEVQGYTSSEGSTAYNLRLSQKRSQSVADYLKQKGMTQRLYAKGYGETHFVAGNDTEADREKNRRVELVWIGD